MQQRRLNMEDGQSNFRSAFDSLTPEQRNWMFKKLVRDVAYFMIKKSYNLLEIGDCGYDCENYVTQAITDLLDNPDLNFSFSNEKRLCRFIYNRAVFLILTDQRNFGRRERYFEKPHGLPEKLSVQSHQSNIEEGPERKEPDRYGRFDPELDSPITDDILGVLIKHSDYLLAEVNRCFKNKPLVRAIINYCLTNEDVITDGESYRAKILAENLQEPVALVKSTLRKLETNRTSRLEELKYAIELCAEGKAESPETAILLRHRIRKEE